MNRVRFLTGAVAVTALVLGAGLAIANSGGPIASATGAPGVAGVPPERTCSRSSCHTGNPVDNGQGELLLLGVPAAYDPGQSYPLTVRLGSSSTAGFGGRRWGFEIVAITADDGRSTDAGSWTIDPTLRRVTNPVLEREYVSHNATSNQTGASSPVEWTLTWTAPPEDRGPVLFYLAGNAANGNGNSSGDFVYTGADTAMGPGTPVEAMRWGTLKRGLGTAR